METSAVYIVAALLPRVTRNVILLLEESTAVSAEFITYGKKGVEVQKMRLVDFKKQHMPALWGKAAFDPKRAAENFLLSKAAITPTALDQLERILNMDTRGKSTVQIHAEVVRLSADLPKGHPLKEVPKSYPDRGTAIAAFTSIRQALLSSTQKEGSNVATSKAAAEAKPAKGKAAPAPAAAKGKAPAATAPAPAAAATKGSKKAAAPAAVEAPKGKGKTNGATAPAAEKAPKAKRKGAVDLTGPFKLSPDAVKAKNAEGLRLHEGSARHTLMTYIFTNSAKKPKGFTYEELEKVVGADQVKQALTGMVKEGYQFLVKA